METSLLVTIWVVAILIILFVYYTRKILQVQKANWTLRKVLSSNDILIALKEQTFEGQIAKNYDHSLCLTLDSGEKKTTEFAEDYFNLDDVLSVRHINRQAMSAAAGMLVGIGVLGTFIGLTLGVASIRLGAEVDLNLMWDSIGKLLGGMKIAFVTSVAGMLLSSLYTLLEKDALNRLNRTCVKLCEKLNDLFYISELEKQQIQNKIFLDHVKAIVHDIKSIDDDANELTIGNMLRDIKKSNENQIDAINAIAENVCNGLGEEFRKLTEAIQNPASNMANDVVSELKSAISQMVNTLNETIKSATKDNLEKVSTQISEAAKTLDTFPKTLALLMEKMQGNMESLSSQIESINYKTAEVGNNIVEKQAGLNQQSANVLEHFQNGIASVESIISKVKDTLLEFENLHRLSGNTIDEIRNAASSVEMATRNLDIAQEKFINGNENIFASTKEILNKTIEDTQKTFDNIRNAVGESASLKNDFEQVQQNLEKIFESINNGLNDYSNAVIDNTSKIMGSFTNPMTDAIKGLKTAIDDLDAVVEEIPNKK